MDKKTIADIEKDGANRAAVQIMYGLPQVPRNPYPKETVEHIHWNIGYYAERAMRGV